jgi:hypothetical protein
MDMDMDMEKEQEQEQEVWWRCDNGSVKEEREKEKNI